MLLRLVIAFRLTIAGHAGFAKTSRLIRTTTLIYIRFRARCDTNTSEIPTFHTTGLKAILLSRAPQPALISALEICKDRTTPFNLAQKIGKPPGTRNVKFKVILGLIVLVYTLVRQISFYDHIILLNFNVLLVLIIIRSIVYSYGITPRRALCFMHPLYIIRCRPPILPQFIRGL